MDATLGNPRFGTHRADTPVGRLVGWLCMQGFVDQFRNPLILNRTRLARSQFIMQSRNSSLDEAPTPLPYRGVHRVQTSRNNCVRLIRRAGLNNLGSLAKRCRQGSLANHRVQLQPLVFAQHQFSFPSPFYHCRISRPKDTAIQRNIYTSYLQDTTLVVGNQYPKFAYH